MEILRTIAFVCAAAAFVACMFAKKQETKIQFGIIALWLQAAYHYGG